MHTINKMAITSGALISVIGIIGTFAHISQDDGALAISGAVIFAAGLISSAMVLPKSVD